MTKINFNCYALGRNGGTRVVLEIANRLQEKGYDVTVTAVANEHDVEWFPRKIDFHLNLISPPSALTRLIQQRLSKRHFQIVRSERLSKIIPKCDINIATACFTAQPTYNSHKGKPFYLVQNYEPWFYTDPISQSLALASYDLPLTKLSVSRWLQQKVGGYYIGSSPADTQVFYPRNTFDQKEPNSILYLYRNIPWKGDIVAILTLEKLQSLGVKIHVVAGKDDVIAGLSTPYEIHHSPSDEELAKIYSKARVLLFTSVFEGSGLPPLEAFACGTNVVSTAFHGNELLINGENSFIGCTPEELARLVVQLLRDNTLSLEQLSKARLILENCTYEKLVNNLIGIFEKS